MATNQNYINYPSASGGISLATPNSAWGYSSFATVVDPLPRGGFITGITFCPDVTDTSLSLDTTCGVLVELWKGGGSTSLKNASSNEANHWTNPDNAHTEDGAYANTNDHLSFEWYHGFDLGSEIPDGAVISGIEVRMKGHAVSTNTGLGVRISWDGGSSNNGSTISRTFNTGADQELVWGGPNDTWGRSWTKSEFQSNNFWVRAGQTNADQRVEVDVISVVVYYNNALVAQVPLTYRVDTRNTHVKPAYIALTEPIQIEGGVTIWARVADSVAAIMDAQNSIKVHLHENATPTVTLNSPADEATVTTSTPQLEFVGTDPENDDITYNLQVDVIDTFDSEDGSFASVNSAVSTGFDTSATTMPVNLPGPIGSGDLLIALVEVRNAGTWTLPDGWNEISGLSQAGGGSVGKLDGFYKIADGTEGATATWTASAGTTAIWQTRKVTSWHGTTPPEAATSSGDVSAADPPSLGPSWGSGNTLWIAVAGHTASSTAAWSAGPSGYSTYEQHGASGGGAAVCIASAYKELNASSEDPGEFTVSGSNRWWAAATIAVRATGSPMLDVSSETDNGFENLDTPADEDPFNSGDEIRYTVQSGDELDDGRYYWRVRGRDPLGSNAWGEWSSVREFTVEESMSQQADSSRGIDVLVFDRFSSARGVEALTKDTEDSSKGLESLAVDTDASNRGVEAGGRDSDSDNRSIEVISDDSADSNRGIEATALDDASSQRSVEASSTDTDDTQRSMEATSFESGLAGRSLEAAGIDDQEDGRLLEAQGSESESAARGLEATSINTLDSQRGVESHAVEQEGDLKGIEARAIDEATSTRSLEAPAIDLQDQTSQKLIEARGLGQSDGNRSIEAYGFGKEASSRLVEAQSIDSDQSQRSLEAHSLDSKDSQRTIESHGVNWHESERGVEAYADGAEFDVRGIELIGLDNKTVDKLIEAFSADTESIQRSIEAIGEADGVSIRLLEVRGIDSILSDKGIEAMGMNRDSDVRAIESWAINSSTINQDFEVVSVSFEANERILEIIAKDSDGSIVSFDVLAESLSPFPRRISAKHTTTKLSAIAIMTKTASRSSTNGLNAQTKITGLRQTIKTSKTNVDVD